MSDSVRPHRRQPIRLPRPWDSPGKNTGVGCHFLLQCTKVKSRSEVAQSFDSSRPRGLQCTRLFRPWDFPGTSTGVGCHCLLRKSSWEGNKDKRSRLANFFYSLCPICSSPAKMWVKYQSVYDHTHFESSVEVQSK